MNGCIMLWNRGSNKKLWIIVKLWNPVTFLLLGFHFNQMWYTSTNWVFPIIWNFSLIIRIRGLGVVLTRNKAWRIVLFCVIVWRLSAISVKIRKERPAAEWRGWAAKENLPIRSNLRAQRLLMTLVFIFLFFQGMKGPLRWSCGRCWGEHYREAPQVGKYAATPRGGVFLAAAEEGEQRPRLRTHREHTKLQTELISHVPPLTNKFITQHNHQILKIYQSVVLQSLPWKQNAESFHLINCFNTTLVCIYFQ